MVKIEVSGITEEELKKSQDIYTDVVARYYGDRDFKAKVDADPATTLRAAGMDIPKNVTVELLFNTDKLLHVVLPKSTDELVDITFPETQGNS